MNRVVRNVGWFLVGWNGCAAFNALVTGSMPLAAFCAVGSLFGLIAALPDSKQGPSS